ncbi:conserved hypothetical protein [Altererythrobacter sp. B11]|uniref:c-type cytochrome n=1 Tax=Altererythrobacter sp. B11 TaxID=2060312 RepID=UPI000DC6EF5F|nr:cytochrome c [Altererythrobacter sp. B11]BBC71934.1 conserved hypothetical protein [Altererythrobacter sp. B11]
MKRAMFAAAAVALGGAALLSAGAVMGQAGADAPAPSATGVGAGPPPMPQPLTLALRPGATGGEKDYVVKCGMCHGPNGMGTGLLARRMDTPLLEARDNLTREYVILAARRGIGNMPAIPRGEVSDAELEAIADYLAAGPHEVAR